MPFPISVSGEVAVRDVTVEQALERLEAALLLQKAGSLRRDGSMIRFRGPFFMFVTSWNALLPVTTGVLEVSPTEGGVTLSYRLTFIEILLALTLILAVLFGPALLAGRAPPVGALVPLAVSVPWIALARWRVAALLARSMSCPVA